MEYLLVMSLSGSTMTASCLLLRRLLQERISAGMYYLLEKAAVLYYLIPLPFLKRWYGDAIRAVLPEKQMEIAQIPLTWTNYAVHADGKLYVNTYAGIQMTTVIVWLSVACLLMARQLLEHLRLARRIAGYTNSRMTSRHKEFLAGIKEQYRVKRPVVLYQGEDGEASMTFGVHRPVIICSREMGSREAELLVCHEMIHIRRLDALWKMFMYFVTFLHWWNPVMWMLYRDFDRVCELSCDEAVMRGRSEEEIKEYLRLLIEEAREDKRPGKALPRWKAGFGENARKIRERMDNLMKKNKWNRYVAGALMATLVFANSMTVFAYRDTFQEVISEDVSQEEIESTLNVDETLFVPEGTVEEATQGLALPEEMEIRYDVQFTDEEGNIYPVPEVELHRGCSHTYVSGTLTDHTKKSDGGCELKQYNAQRCSKCGLVVRGSLISSHYYATCPH